MELADPTIEQAVARCVQQGATKVRLLLHLLPLLPGIAVPCHAGLWLSALAAFALVVVGCLASLPS